jgi:hypothetical protein
MQRENCIMKSFINYIDIIRQSQLHFYLFSIFIHYDKLWTACLSSDDSVHVCTKKLGNMSNIKFYEKKNINLRKQQ